MISDNWLSDAPLGLGWEGVTTDGRVTELDAARYGEIPAELDLSSEQRLSGEIPAELGSLSNLESWTSATTLLSGEIPPELGSLSRIWTATS